jgi:mRNA interferase MazF
MVWSKMPEIKRGQVWHVALDPAVGSEQAKTRPCVVVQRDSANATSPVTIVCPLTDAKGSAGSVVAVKVAKGEGGLKKDSLVLCNQVRTVSHHRLQRFDGVLDARTMQTISGGLRAILDL